MGASACLLDTPSGHEERGMHSKPPPSSLTPKKHRWRPLYGTRPRPAGSDSLSLSVFVCTTSPLALFLAFVRRLYTQQESTQCGEAADLPEGHTGPGRGPLIKELARARSTNITPLSKRTPGPTGERLCYCNWETVRSWQIANMAPNAGLWLNPTQDLKVESSPASRLTTINQINHLH